jgi:hypothetical protein
LPGVEKLNLIFLLGLMDMESKKTSDLLIVLTLTAFTVTFFLLQVSGSWTAITLANNVQSAVIVIVYCIIAVFSLVVLLFSNAGKTYYQNLKPVYLVYVVVAAGVMYLVSVVSANYFPAALQPLTSIPGQTSVTTSVLSDVLFTFTVVALAEELLKFAGYTEFKEHYRGKGHLIMWLMALVPVFLWAGFHAIQAYNSVWYLIPAFVDGLVLLALLEATHAFLAPVLAHGTYNSILIVTSYLTTSSSLPLFPAVASASDFFLVVLCVVWFVLVILPVLLRSKSRGGKGIL